MKHSVLLFVTVVFTCAGLNAQQAKKGVTTEYSQFTLSSFSPLNASGSQSAMLLGGRLEKGKKEQFGAMLGTSQAAIIEFLDAGNKAIKALNSSDLLGKSTSGVKLVRTSGDELGTQSEAVYDVAFPQGKGEFAIHSIVAGGASGSKPKIILSFQLKGAVGDVAGIRISLPIDGQVVAQESGFVISAKTQPAAFAAAVFPKPKSVNADKNMLSIVTAVPAGAQSASGTTLLWMVVEGSSSSNAAAAKTEATALLKTNAQYSADPNLVIVTTANKVSTQPTDTVTYLLVCTNIGLGNATDVVLSNPIPAGTSFLEGSAEGQGTSITIEREKATAPQLGLVKSVNWKLNEPLKPGAEKIVSFKIIVR